MSSLENCVESTVQGQNSGINSPGSGDGGSVTDSSSENSFHVEVQSKYSNSDYSDYDRSNSTDDKKSPLDSKPAKKKHRSRSSQTPQSINYRGTNMESALRQGNLPVCVLLWGMAAAKRIDLLVPDDQGSNPFHYAAMAETTDVFSFLAQQSKATHPSSTASALLHAKNARGETPLLCAAMYGRIPLVKTLLDLGCDPCVQDYQGNHVFLMCAKNSHLWCLHYLFSFLSSKLNETATLELLFRCDSEGHNCLDWASERGDVNMMEYLIRQGLSPYRLDAQRHSPLFWAVKNNQLAAVRLLIRLGCDPHEIDLYDNSPLTLAKTDEVHSDILCALTESPWIKLDASAFNDWEAARGTGVSFSSSTWSVSSLTSSNMPVSNLPNSTIPMNPSSALDTMNLSEGSLVGDVENGDRSNALELRPLSKRMSNNPLLVSEDVTNRASTSSSAGSPVPKLFRGLSGLTSSTLTTTTSTSQNSKDICKNAKDVCEILPQHPPLYRISNGKQQSMAIERLSYPRMKYANIYWLIVFLMISISIYVPFWAWIAGLLVLYYIYSKSENFIRNETDKAMNPIMDHNNSNNNNNNNNSRTPLHVSIVHKLPSWKEAIVAQEKFIGLYLGTCFAMILYFVLSVLSSVEHWNHLGPLSSLTSYQYDFSLFLVCCALTTISMFLWYLLVFVLDPGIVDTRDRDFREVMEQSLRFEGPPPHQYYCKTTLVRKPIRSKYCVQSGVVVARMDHYCVWLCNSIGFGNHQTFIVFIYFSFATSIAIIILIMRDLIRGIGHESACSTTSFLLGQAYFFPFVLLSLSVIISLGLLALILEQTHNIFKNMTTNECINRSHYFWMSDDTGRPCNRFDRGPWFNLLEFIGIGSYRVDYYSIFELPNPVGVTTCSHENV